MLQRNKMAKIARSTRWKKTRKQQTAIKRQRNLDSMCCPSCQNLLVGVNAVRLQPRQKLSTKMQKLICREKENKESLTCHQQELVHKSLQCCNVLVLKCAACKWRGKTKLRTREAFRRQKAFLTQKAKTENQSQALDVDDSQIIPYKRMKQKMRKKERRRKVAEAKVLQLGSVSRLVKNPPAGTTAKSEGSSNFTAVAFSSPSSSSQSKPLSHAKTVSVKAGKTSAKSGPVTPFKGVLGLQSGKVAKRGKRQQLQKALNKRNKGGLSAKESLSQFLNSLK